jgi:hexosaminidase
MTRLLLVFFFLFFAHGIFAQHATLNLMPVPAKLESGSEKFRLTSELVVGVKVPSKDQLVIPAVNRLLQKLKRKGAFFSAQDFISLKDNRVDATLQVEVQQAEANVIGVDESYHLAVNGRRIELKARNSMGALRGMETILQLVDRDSAGSYIPGVTIDDKPRFAWRGLMIDVSRHFIPIENIKRNIEAMAVVKLNVLHLHLTDDQGFRVESKTFPALHQKGSNGEYYTQAQIKELIAFAHQRGILIVPEFDIPGHSTSWFAGYPNLASTEGPFAPGQPFKVDRSKPLDVGKLMQLFYSSPLPVFDPTREEVYNFLDKFFAEMAGLFPGEYFHIGADENNGVAWNQNTAIAAYMTRNNMKSTHELQAFFVKRISAILKKYKKKVIGWEEMFDQNLSTDIMVQVWKPGSTVYKSVAEKGNPLLLSSGFYLDHFLPAHVHYQVEIPAQVTLGGEAAQWTEIADAQNIETRMWPRAAAIAERFWSPAEIINVDDMYRRLFSLNNWLDAVGLMHISNYQRFFRQSDNEYGMRYKSLVDVLSPVKGYKKLFAALSLPEAYSNATAPLLRVSDIATIDPETKYRFRKLVSNWIERKDTLSGQAISQQLNEWIGLPNDLKKYFNSNAIAKEIEMHAVNLSGLSKSCLELLGIQRAGREGDSSWLSKQKQFLAEASKSYGDTELAVLPELEALLTGKLAPLPKVYPLF